MPERKDTGDSAKKGSTERGWRVSLRERAGSGKFDTLVPFSEAADAGAASKVTAPKHPNHEVTAVRRQTHKEAAAEAAFQDRLYEQARKRDAHHEAVKLRRFGEDSPPWATVPTEVWASTLDEGGQPTGYVARKAGRTLGAIAEDLRREFAKLDVYEDPLDVYVGGEEATRRAEGRREDELPVRSFAEEGLSVCFWTEYGGRKGADVEWPERVARVLCYAVTGGSEGHYAHVDLILSDRDDPAPPSPRDMVQGAAYLRYIGDSRPQHAVTAEMAIAEERKRASEASRGRVMHLSAFTCKTFYGFDAAWRITQKFAELLGA